jgi:hypothetical protein
LLYQEEKRVRYSVTLNGMLEVAGPERVGLAEMVQRYPIGDEFARFPRVIVLFFDRQNDSVNSGGRVA